MQVVSRKAVARLIRVATPRRAVSSYMAVPVTPSNAERVENPSSGAT